MPISKRRHSPRRHVELCEMTADELLAELEAVTGLPMPESGTGPDFHRWYVLSATQIFASFGIAPEEALRLAGLHLLASHIDPRSEEVEMIFAEAIGHAPTADDWQATGNARGLLIVEYEWAKALS